MLVDDLLSLQMGKPLHDGMDPRLIEGVSRGIDPLRGHGVGRIDQRFLRALAISRNRDANIRAHNAAVAVSKGELYPYETPFKSDKHVYTLRRIRELNEHVHDQEIPMFDPAVGGLNSGRVLKDELIHAMTSPKSFGVHK